MKNCGHLFSLICPTGHLFPKREARFVGVSCNAKLNCILYKCNITTFNAVILQLKPRGYIFSYIQLKLLLTTNKYYQK